jgi:MFS transporter, ACS family, tartrate transporter
MMKTDVESELGRTVLRKVALRLIPLLCVLYFFAFLDRVNVSFAALTMNADLGLSAAVFGMGSGIFFLGYVLFEVPSNVMLERFGARIWIARIMLSWGLLSGAMAFIQGTTSFYVVRFLLGAAEAGFFPGIIYYLTCWFPMRQRARIIATFMLALPLSSVIGAPISTSLLDLDWLGLQGWQWMFLLEAIPTIILGLAVLRLLTDRPADAKWLTSAEREWLARALESEHTTSHQHASSLRAALVLPRVWQLGIVYFGILVGLYGFGFWLPQILASLSTLSNVQVGLATMIPYALACISIVLVGRSSDVTGERPLHVAVPALLGAIALIGSGLSINPLLSFIALSVAAVGIYSGLPAFWAFASQGLQGVAAAGAIALINSIGNLGGFLGPAAIGFVKQRTGTYTASLVLIAACLVVTALLVMWMRTRSAPMVAARQETY